MRFSKIAETIVITLVIVFVISLISLALKSNLAKGRCIEYGALDARTTIKGTYCIATLNGTSLTFPVEEIDERALRR